MLGPRPASALDHAGRGPGKYRCARRAEQTPRSRPHLTIHTVRMTGWLTATNGTLQEVQPKQKGTGPTRPVLHRVRRRAVERHFVRFWSHRVQLTPRFGSVVS